MIDKLIGRLTMLWWILTKGSIVMIQYDVYDDNTTKLDIVGSTQYSHEHDAKMIQEVGNALVENI